MSKTSNLILSLVADNPNWDNEQIADEVQKRLPNAKTSAASVSSVKSRARKEGLLETAAPVAMSTASPEVLDLPDETPLERTDRIRRKYATLDRMAHRVASGKLPSLVVSGPPGLGKSWTVEQVLDKSGKDFDLISGTITAPMLYMALYAQRDGGIVVLDDCDDVFRDETMLNLLKAVLDSSEIRRVSYRKLAHWMEENDIPTEFEFEGSVVFCTNLDFELAIRKGTSMAVHFEAIIDRSLYLSLTMRTTEDFLTRIEQVAIEDDMMVKRGLTQEDAGRAFLFVKENAPHFYTLSLRLMIALAECIKEDPINWEDDIRATKMRTI